MNIKTTKQLRESKFFQIETNKKWVAVDDVIKHYKNGTIFKFINDLVEKELKEAQNEE